MNHYQFQPPHWRVHTDPLCFMSRDVNVNWLCKFEPNIRKDPVPGAKVQTVPASRPWLMLVTSPLLLRGWGVQCVLMRFSRSRWVTQVMSNLDMHVVSCKSYDFFVLQLQCSCTWCSAATPTEIGQNDLERGDREGRKKKKTSGTVTKRKSVEMFRAWHYSPLRHTSQPSPWRSSCSSLHPSFPLSFSLASLPAWKRYK